MRKNVKKIITCSLITLLSFGCIACMISLNNSSLFDHVKANEKTYVLEFDSIKNKLTSSNTKVTSVTKAKTSEGNDIDIAYTNIADYSSGWVNMKESGSTIYNQTPITGLKSITIKGCAFGSDLDVICYEDNLETSLKTMSFYVLGGDLCWDFDNTNPNYFKIVSNMENLEIGSVILEYSCQ